MPDSLTLQLIISLGTTESAANSNTELLLSVRMERSEGDFKTLGEGFNRFPKTIPEDCVAYTIYIIDAKLSDFQVQEQLRQVQKAGIKLTNELLKDFIWQREHIHFDLVREKGKLPICPLC